MVNKLLFVTFLLSMCMLSCAGNSNLENEPRSPLLASTLACPEATMYPTPTHTKKAVYILLDNSASYENYYGNASQRLQEVLVQTLWPGDFVGIGLIGQEAANVTMPNTVFPHPQEPTPPNFTPTLTPLPNDALGSDLQQHEIENGYIVRENEDLRDKYYCSIEDWNNMYNLSTSQRSNLPIFETIRKAIPAQSQAEGSTDLQSAMFNAHDFFSQARKQGYTNLKLIIFSDMLETEPPREWVDSIDLSGVSVVAAMVPFEEVSRLKVSQDEWANWFEVYGVADFELLTVPNSSKSLLVSYLEN